MTVKCRSWWRNCALHADSEITSIDAMEDRIATIGASVLRVRELISSLELCHHKADRWVYNIIEAIGVGETEKGLGTRLPGQHHPRELVWQYATAALSAWSAGSPSSKVDVLIDTQPASRLLASLGARSPLKEWQVQRVVEKIRSVSHWPQSVDNPDTHYVPLLLDASDYESAFLRHCPERYKEHESYWRTTVCTILHDSKNGDEADLSLALAIDMLWPCHWNFVENLGIVVDAIGGTLYSRKSFAACGRNISRVPIRRRMEIVSNTLKVFYASLQPDHETDSDLLLLLGKPSEEKQWLAASLDKTIRLQLSPPADLRAISSLAGPEWIKQSSID